MNKKKENEDYLALFMSIGMGVLGVVVAMLVALIAVVFDLA